MSLKIPPVPFSESILFHFQVCFPLWRQKWRLPPQLFLDLLYLEVTISFLNKRMNLIKSLFMQRPTPFQEELLRRRQHLFTLFFNFFHTIYLMVYFHLQPLHPKSFPPPYIPNIMFFLFLCPKIKAKKNQSKKTKISQ